MLLFICLFVFLQLGCRVTGCLNGGSCFFDNDKETFVCSCILSWRGERCELGRRAINSFQFSCLSYKNILRAQVNGTLIQLLTSKEPKIIVLFSLKVQTRAPATHVCMGQRAPTFWMVTLAHAQHISQANGARFLSVSRLIHRWKLPQLSLCTSPLPSGKIREFSRGEGVGGGLYTGYYNWA